MKDTRGEQTKRKLPMISKISAMHYAKLVLRSVIFMAAAAAYIYAHVRGIATLNGAFFSLIKTGIWILFSVEMLFRFFPSSMESMGCQKVFECNYRPADTKIPLPDDRKSTAAVAIAWILLNGLIGAVYIAGLIDKGILVLLSLAYSVCDMICILFFCPFQEWFMKNKCCGTCRIYNWDYAMMFTPLVFVGGIWGWSLLGLSLGLLLKWEITFRLHPERFYEQSNCSLACANCQEKLCRHKKSLQRFLRKMGRRVGMDG